MRVDCFMIEEMTVGRWTPWCYYLCPVFLQGVLIMAKSSWIRSKKLALGIAVALGCSLMSVASDGKDQQETEERLLETADEIVDVFASRLPVNVVRQLRNLLIEHIEIGGEIIQALKTGNMENYDGLVKEWYSNANQIATLLGEQNPFFAGRDTRNMLLNHLDLTREEIEQQINGAYAQSIDTFRDIVDQTVKMADFFSQGLLAR